MKKLVLLFAAATMAVSLSAQTVEESKVFDNIYVGINGGVATKTTGNRWLSNLNPNAGIRVGRWFTPVFGLAVEGSAYFNDRAAGQHSSIFGAYAGNTHTTVTFVNTSLLGTVNFSNLFGGYKGTPRAFEVAGVYGMGWAHAFGCGGHRADALTSKAGVDFAYNFGSDKQWQVYVEPSITWALCGNRDLGYNGAYNLDKSFVQLNAGVVYKFKNSNGTHNFKIARLMTRQRLTLFRHRSMSFATASQRLSRKLLRSQLKSLRRLTWLTTLSS